MGSIGVSTGRLLGRQVADILEGRVVAVDKRGNQLGLPDVIRVYPNNSRESDREGFVLNMRGVPKEQREKFLNLWKGQSNVDNSDRSAAATERKALAQGASPEEARRLGEEARANVTKRAMQNVLTKDANSGNPLFTGITIDNVKRRRRS